MKTILATLKAINDMKDLTVHELVILADCYAIPPEANSPGGKFLRGVRDGFLDAYAKHSDFTSLVDDFRRISRHAGEYPEHQVKEKWQAFVELGAWEEGLNTVVNMNAAATQALALVAERLLYALYEEIKEEIRRLSS